MSGIVNALCLNNVGNVDAAFFIVCAVIIAAIVGVYFLIPVFNKQLYKEQRENLHKREAAFKSNLQHGVQNERSAEAKDGSSGESDGSDACANE